MLTECQLRADSFVATRMDMCVLCYLIVECFGALFGSSSVTERKKSDSPFCFGF